MTEQELIAGISARERAAINHLVSTYQKKVIKTAYYFTGNMEDAEELSQDIFVEIIRSIDSFRCKSSFSTWIYRITINRSINLIRKNNRRKIFSSIEHIFQNNNDIEGETVNEPHDHPEPSAEDETREFLNKAVNELSGNQKIAFVLNKYEELSYKEISDIMGLSLSSVESLIHRAKMNIQQKLVRKLAKYPTR